MLKGYKDIVKNHEFRHRYLYDENKQRAGVVILVKEEIDGKSKYYAGYSICSKLEKNFDKELGKAIAILRAKSGKADFDKIPDKFRKQAEIKLAALSYKY